MIDGICPVAKRFSQSVLDRLVVISLTEEIIIAMRLPFAISHSFLLVQHILMMGAVMLWNFFTHDVCGQVGHQYSPYSNAAPQ